MPWLLGLWLCAATWSYLFLYQVMDSIYALMSIGVPKVLKMQQADSLFTSMSSEKKDFVTKDEFIAYFNKDEVGKYL